MLLALSEGKAMNMIITEAACAYINAAIEKQQGKGFRLSVKKTGCSGYSYVPSVVETVIESDQLIEQAGLALYIDPLWQHLLDDIKIDVVEDMKSGLKQKKLMIANNKEAGRCGCGESFHIDK